MISPKITFHLGVSTHFGNHYIGDEVTLTGKVILQHTNRKTRCYVEITQTVTERKIVGKSGYLWWKKTATEPAEREVTQWVNADDITCFYVEELNLV